MFRPERLSLSIGMLILSFIFRLKLSRFTPRLTRGGFFPGCIRRRASN